MQAASTKWTVKEIVARSRCTLIAKTLLYVTHEAAIDFFLNLPVSTMILHD